MSQTTDDVTFFEARLNQVGVQMERQKYKDVYDEVHTWVSTVFTMGTHARLGSGCLWLAELEAEVCSMICALASPDLCDLTWASICASPCPMSAIESRMLLWYRLWHTNTARVKLWACILELQRLLNRCWQKGSVTFLVPSDGQSATIDTLTWWTDMSWFGWSQMRIVDPRSFHDDIMLMINTQPRLWTGIHSLFNILGQCAVFPDGRRLNDSDVEFTTLTNLVRYEDWTFYPNAFYMHVSILE